MNAAGRRRLMSPRPLLAELAKEWLKRKLGRGGIAKSTRYTYTRAITAYIIDSALGQEEVRYITWQHVQDWYDELHASRPGQAALSLYLLGAVFTWCERTNIIPRGSSPARGIDTVPPPKYERMLTGAELDRLNATLDEWHDQPFADGIRMLLLTGMRRGEAVKLDASHLLVIKEGTATVRLDTKSGRSTRYLGKAAFNLIRERVTRKDGSYLKRGKLLPGFTLYRAKTMWPLLRKEAMLGNLRLHDLRHTFVSVAINAGVPLEVVGGTVGHTNKTTTELYAHLQDATKMDVARIVEEAMA